MKADHAATNFYVTDFGAIGDGKTINTFFIPKAIDTCYQSGGENMIWGNTYVFKEALIHSIFFHMALLKRFLMKQHV